MGMKVQFFLFQKGCENIHTIKKIIRIHSFLWESVQRNVMCVKTKTCNAQNKKKTQQKRATFLNRRDAFVQCLFFQLIFLHVCGMFKCLNSFS